MKIIYCENGCCEMETSTFIKTNKIVKHKSNFKAGVFIYNPIHDKVLIVQSNGKLWGAPKGSLKRNENISQCACREVLEETGLVIDKKSLKISTNIKTKAVYYYIEFDDLLEVSIQKLELNDADTNDVNSIGWVKPSCIKQLIENDKMRINKHFSTLLERFLKFKIY